MRALTLSDAALLCAISSPFNCDLNSFNSFSTLSETLISLTLSSSAIFFNSYSSVFINSSAAKPVTASIRLVPAETLPSEIILNGPISPVALQWVPPQSSAVKSPARTTLTLSPYFSPKSAMAPFETASSMVVHAILTGEFSITFSLTIPSTSCSSLSSIA